VLHSRGVGRVEKSAMGRETETKNVTSSWIGRFAEWLSADYEGLKDPDRQCAGQTPVRFCCPLQCGGY